MVFDISELLISLIPLGDLLSDWAVIFSEKAWAGSLLQRFGLFIFAVSQYSRFVFCGRLLTNVDSEDRWMNLLRLQPKYFFWGVAHFFLACAYSVSPPVLSIFWLGLWASTGQHYTLSDFDLPTVDVDKERERCYYRGSNFFLIWWRYVSSAAVGTRAIVYYLGSNENDDNLVTFAVWLAIIEELLENIAGFMLVTQDLRNPVAQISLAFTVASVLFETGSIFGMKKQRTDMHREFEIMHEEFRDFLPDKMVLNDTPVLGSWRYNNHYLIVRANVVSSQGRPYDKLPVTWSTNLAEGRHVFAVKFQGNRRNRVKVGVSSKSQVEGFIHYVEDWWEKDDVIAVYLDIIIETYYDGEYMSTCMNIFFYKNGGLLKKEDKRLKKADTVHPKIHIGYPCRALLADPIRVNFLPELKFQQTNV